MSRQSIILADHEARRLQSGAVGSVLAVRPIEPPKCTTLYGRTPCWPKARVDPGGTIFGPGPYLHLPYGGGDFSDPDEVSIRVYCPYDVGTRLAVRETWGEHPDDGGTLYRATDPGWDDNDTGLPWKSASTMPIERSRATVEVTAVECRRVCEITEEQACNAGHLASCVPGMATMNSCNWWFKEDWEQRFGARYPWAESWAWFVALEKRP